MFLNWVQILPQTKEIQMFYFNQIKNLNKYKEKINIELLKTLICFLKIKVTKVYSNINIISVVSHYKCRTCTVFI